MGKDLRTGSPMRCGMVIALTALTLGIVPLFPLHPQATHAAGSVSFATPVTYPAAISPQSVVGADVNRDGKPDIVVANSSSNTVGVLLGNGDGTFQAIQPYTTGPYSYPEAVTVADVNGDGKLDIVVANKDNDTVGVFLGNGDGTFQAQQTYATGASPDSVALADVNGDGKLDIVTADRSPYSNAISVLLNTTPTNPPTVTPTNTATATATTTATATPTASKKVKATATPTRTPTITPTATKTGTPMPTPTKKH